MAHDDNVDTCDNYLIDCLRVLRTNKIGPMSYFLLKEKYKNCKKIIEALEECGTKVSSIEAARTEIENHKKISAVLLEKDMINYPEKLKKYSKHFPIISVKGNLEIFKKKSLGIVGARQSSITGREFTKLLVHKIRNEYVTVSGMAIGIDTIVGENSITSGHIGVMPGGINNFYPPQSYNLYNTIMNSTTSCLISCQIYNQEAKKTLFPIRNKLIAALSDAVIITEAKLRSGSLQTAKFAMNDYKKPVFVVPGHPLDENYEGNNELLNQLAGIPLYNNTDITESINNYYRNLGSYDIFSDNDYLDISTEFINMENANNEQLKRNIFSLISLTPVSISHVQHYLNQPLPIVISTCILMEIEGQIIIHSNMTITKAIEQFFFNDIED